MFAYVKKYRWVLYSFIALIIVIRLLTCFRTVGVGQIGIVTSYGTVKGEVNSGLHFIPPWQTVAVMSIQTQKDNVDAAAATIDQQQLDTNVNLNYHLNPGVVSTLFRKTGVNYDSVLVQPAIQEAVKANTAKYTVEQELANRPKIEAAIIGDLNGKLIPLGIVPDSFSVINFGFSAQYSAAIESKQVEQQKVQAAQYQLQQAQLNAQANSVQDTSLTPAILEQQAIKAWDGHMPQSVGAGTTIFGIPLTK